MTELSDPISTNKAKSLRIFELEDTPELSSTLASHDDDIRNDVSRSIS